MKRLIKRFQQLKAEDRRALSGGLIGVVAATVFFLYSINLVDLETRLTISLWMLGLCALVGAIGEPTRADEQKALGRGALLGAVMAAGLVLAAPSAALAAVVAFAVHATEPWWFVIHGVLIGALTDLVLTLRFGAAQPHGPAKKKIEKTSKSARSGARDHRRRGREGRNTA